MSIKLTIGECESAASKYHSVAREVGNQKAGLTSTSGSVKDAWRGGAAEEWAHRIDIVANQVEQGVADDISSVGDLLDDVAQDARTLRGKAEALPASLGGSGDSGGARLVLDDGAAGGVRGDVTALGEALDRVEPAIADIRGILSQLRTCSLGVDDAAEAAVKDAKGKLETFSGDWDAYLSGVSSLVDKITSGMAKLDPNEPAMRENATAKAVANYAKSAGAAAALRGLATNSCAYGGDPVNMVTGNFIYPELDLRLGGTPGASVERMYNSDSPEVGLFGLGWSSTLDERLAFDGALVTHLRPDGRRRAFAPAGDGDVWKTVDEAEETITREGDSYVLERPDGTSRAFDGDGRLVEVRDPLGVTAVVRRDGAGLPVRLETGGGGRHVDVTYAGTRVALVRDHAGREVSYAYEGDLLASVTKPDGATWGYAYDGKGRLCGVVDPAGRWRLRQSYDAHGRVSRQRMAGEGEDVFSYATGSTAHESARSGREAFVQDEQGRTTEVRRGTVSERYTYTERNLWEGRLDGAGARTRWGYDAAGDVSRMELPSGAGVDIERDGRRVSGVTVAGRRFLSVSYEDGLPTSVTDGEGNAFAVSWDEDGGGLSVVDPDGTRTSIALNASREPVSLQVPGEGETRVERDPLGRPTRVVTPSGTVRYGWDAEGRLTSEQAEGEDPRTYAYDARGDLARVTEGEHRLSVERDEAGRVVRAELDDGQWMSAAYDEAGRMTSCEDSHGRTLACEYDEAGRLRRATDAAGSWVEWSYDKAGRPVRSRASSGAESTVAYGFDGRVRSVSDNRTGGFSIARDALGRAIASFDGEGLLFEARRDTRGAITSTKNAVGETAHFERDWAGRIVRVAADGVSASVSRDAAGRTSAVSVSEGGGGPALLEERRTYTKGGRLSRIEGPLGTESFTWARDGSLRSHEDALGTTTSQVGTDGRSMRVTRPDGSVWEGSLSHDMRRATVSDGGASVAVSFDGLGHPVRADMGDGTAVDYEYDGAGRLLSVAHSRAPKVTYAYDRADRVSGITQGDMGVRYAYDDAGRIARREFSDGTSVSYAYDGRGNLASLVARDADGYDALSEGYSYDRLGRRVARTVTRDGATSEFAYSYAYSYDGAGRLLSVSEDGRERDAWDYDALGNVLRASTPRGTTTYAYDAAGRMASSEGPEGTRRYEWDARSRLSRVTDGEGAPVLELSWDAADRLVSSTNERGTTTYGYDALGNRVCQEGPDGSFGWAIDPLRATRNTLGWGREGDLRPALADGAMPLWSSGTCLVSDANGTPLATTSDLATTLLEDPFGQGGWDGLAFGYAGYTPDPATGLLHARLRDYDPSARRFCSPDPRRGYMASPRTLNRWACCFGDPVNLVDVDGGWPDVGKWFSDRAHDAQEFWDKQVYGIDRTLKKEEVDIDGVKVGGETYRHTGGGIIVVQRNADNETTGVNLNLPSISIPGTKIKVSTSASLRWGEKWGISDSVNYTNGDGPTSSYGWEVSHSGVGVKHSVSSKLPNIIGTTIGTRASVGKGFSWPQIGYAAALVGMTVLVIVAVADNAVGVEGVDEAPAAAGWAYVLRQLLSAPAFAAACAG
ncbi:RHS repeat-associated protein [Olsenella profusa DSM 13989]|uniref:DUF6531 domain-containing protein n=1 Tax=Olsenella profusa TaxID=138595 RepID=UPI00277F13FA|nr:DUF6531 domain-containing protein [Olsenella profusa]MDP9859142.1 RHS repeat-associated protein [Olsenella profusa DSM 13989]